MACFLSEVCSLLVCVTPTTTLSTLYTRFTILLFVPQRRQTIYQKTSVIRGGLSELFRQQVKHLDKSNKLMVIG